MEYSRAVRKLRVTIMNYHPASMQAKAGFKTWQGKFFRLYKKSPTAAKNKTAVWESRKTEWRTICSSTKNPTLMIMERPVMRRIFWDMYMDKLVAMPFNTVGNCLPTCLLHVVSCDVS